MGTTYRHGQLYLDLRQHLSALIWSGVVAVLFLIALAIASFATIPSSAQIGIQLVLSLFVGIAALAGGHSTFRWLNTRAEWKTLIAEQAFSSAGMDDRVWLEMQVRDALLRLDEYEKPIRNLVDNCLMESILQTKNGAWVLPFVELERVIKSQVQAEPVAQRNLLLRLAALRRPA